ncbi:MAG: carbohydrate kinase family protein [Gemmatimonadales bacterium]|nr:MAG: carbohydrate kinase family protein [Gemmatimonadales bacterium]
MDPHEDWGGITYSLEAFDAARSDDWTGLPIAKVGADLFERAVDRVSGLDGVDSVGALIRVPQQNNRVDLHYSDSADRCEHLQGGVPAWTWDELAPIVATCDALYVNFIAGWELDLPIARRLRQEFDGPVYCDIHSLLLGTDRAGVRVRRELVEWPEWRACFDLIQGNRDELRIVTGGIDDPVSGVRSLVSSGVGAAFATLGSDGVAWATPSDSPWLGARSNAVDEVTVRVVGPADTPSVVDTTGCGDVWGATCFTTLLAGQLLPSAVALANRFGALTAGLRGTSDLGTNLRTGLLAELEIP